MACWPSSAHLPLTRTTRPAPRGPPWTFRPPYSSVLSILRKAGWQDPELDSWLERAAHMPDRAARMALYRQADRRLVMEQALVVPWGYGDVRRLSQPWVRRIPRNGLGYLNLKDVVVEKQAST